MRFPQVKRTYKRYNMLLRTKKTLISLLVIICAVLFAAIVTALTQSVGKVYAYTTEQLEGAAVIDIYNKDTKKFTEKRLTNIIIFLFKT